MYSSTIVAWPFTGNPKTVVMEQFTMYSLVGTPRADMGHRLSPPLWLPGVDPPQDRNPDPHGRCVRARHSGNSLGVLLSTTP